MASTVVRRFCRLAPRLLTSVVSSGQQPPRNLGISTIRNNSTYRAAVLQDFGQDLVIQDFKRKKIKSGQVRVAVYSCGVNASDLLMMENKYDQVFKPPFVPGFEICGEVMELGEDVKSVAVGSRVIGISKENLGGFAEECVISEQDLWMVDHAVGFDSGAALVDTYATALIGLHRRAGVHEGSTVLITAAAGGLGLAAVDLASSVYKAKVIGVCGTEDKADLVRQKGAWAALKYNKKHIIAKVNEVTGGKGVDIIFDAVGGDVFNDCLSCVAHEGSVIVAGFASRVIPHIETSQLLPKAVSLIGLSLTHYRDADNNVYRQAVEDIIEMHEMGLIKPHISALFKLEDTKSAFAFMTERMSTGKVVLEIR
ncbi:quinone oxidoreductase-like protein 2 homolog [Homarus americanus]|uniref:Quinone oxidoreductase-like protein 2-like n=1 Tax=Homarus americanus TaxID=6706 RepID=A0A8J5JRK8_HOMAM|nr:quinone oxidoreductase-like protein 2 homolog [Homarus americanus]XP_042232960.1 quinone oxidoreductase-like protein 2 homolog [Homarus americanus]XP_042232961.1 quinone oxidoreductase-like protein 2 homolog [Homarus americanus]XP_042232962.1 quinone oxidoreductase-like protein 2 homolog [Homarus americanus]XP_042232963.1 quinone oxidoreductase-like protein 2 homolog [Homarus americanus]KAG7162856.1 Quinone oxidoreductase-like protein 2-like [Homarus americanus]